MVKKNPGKLFLSKSLFTLSVTLPGTGEEDFRVPEEKTVGT